MGGPAWGAALILGSLAQTNHGNPIQRGPAYIRFNARPVIFPIFRKSINGSPVSRETPSDTPTPPIWLKVPPPTPSPPFGSPYGYLSIGVYCLRVPFTFSGSLPKKKLPVGVSSTDGFVGHLACLRRNYPQRLV